MTKVTIEHPTTGTGSDAMKDSIPKVIGRSSTIDAYYAAPTAPTTTLLPFPQLVTAEVVAEWLNVSVRRVYELARHEGIPHVKLGRNVRFDPDELQQWIRSGGTPLPGGWRREPQGDQE